MKLNVEPDFEKLLPTLSDNELGQLETNLLASEKTFPPIAVWSNHKNTILDGHNQYRLRLKHGLPIRVSKHKFETRDEALRFAFERQLGRRNLTSSQLAMVAKQFMGGEKPTNTIKQGQKSGANLRPRPAGANLRQADKVGKLVGVSARSVNFARKVDEHGATPIVKAVESGEVKVSDAASVVDLPKPTQTAALKEVKAGRAKTLREAVKPKPGKQTITPQQRKDAAKALGVLVRFFCDRLKKESEAKPHLDALNKLLKAS